MPLSADAVAAAAYAAGFRGDALATIVAIAFGESGLDPDAVGDVSLAGARTPNGSTWGPSIGLWQIRSIEEESGTGRSRDATRLRDPNFNARSAWQISGGGSNFGAWSVYTSQAHRRHLDAARAAAASVEARGGSPAAPTTVTAPSTGPATSLGTSEDSDPPAGTLSDSYVPPNRISGFNLNGRPFRPGEAVYEMPIGGGVSMTTDQVTEVTLVYADPRGDHPVWNQFRVETEVHWFDLPLMVASVDWGEQDGIEILTVTMRALGAQKMRALDPRGLSKTWHEMSPTEVLADRASEAGMRFYGKGTQRRPTITRHGRDDTGQATAESDWDMAQRLAREEGFWAFETAGAFYFAPPSWLIERGTRFPVRHRPGDKEAAFATLGIPQAIQSVDTDRIAGIPIREIIAPLPRWRGELVRPAMSADFKGIPGFDATYLVTSVEFPFDGGVQPATVTMTEAVDPVPEPPADMSTGGSAAHDDHSHGTPGGMGSTGGGKGPYGYQYDPAGTQFAGKTQPGTKVLMDHILGRFAGTANSGTYAPRNVAGTNKVSVHAEGRAGDVGVPLRSALGDQVAEYLVRNASLFGIQYVIWNNQQWRATDRTWKPYSHPGGNTPTLRHEDHVHFEQNWEAAKGLTAGQIAGATSTLSRSTPPL